MSHCPTKPGFVLLSTHRPLSVHANGARDPFGGTYELRFNMAASSEIRCISKVVALITGGASGLGKATAARLARQVKKRRHLAKPQ